MCEIHNGEVTIFTKLLIRFEENIKRFQIFKFDEIFFKYFKYSEESSFLKSDTSHLNNRVTHLIRQIKLPVSNSERYSVLKS